MKLNYIMPAGVSVKSSECSWALISVQRAGDTRSSRGTPLWNRPVWHGNCANTWLFRRTGDHKHIAGMCSPLCVKPSEAVGLLHPCEWVTDSNTDDSYVTSANGQQQCCTQFEPPPAWAAADTSARQRQSWCVVNFSTTLASDGQKVSLQHLTFKLIHVI